MTLPIRFALAAVLPLLFACAGNEATPPNDDDVGDNTGTDATGTDSGTSDATDDTSTETATDTGEDCVGPDGCFACEPSSSIELTNACTDATCEPFANTPERLPLLERDGGLPPLP